MRVYLSALSVHRAEPRANIVFTRTHGFAVQIIWYYCTYSTYAGETLRQLASPSAELRFRFFVARPSRRDFNIAPLMLMPRIVPSLRCRIYIYMYISDLAARARCCNDYYATTSCAPRYHTRYTSPLHLSARINPPVCALCAQFRSLVIREIT